MPAMPPRRQANPVPGLLGALLLLGLAACRPPRNPLAEWLPSPNYNARRPVLVILHHTAGNSFDQALKILKTHNDGGPVSSHYLIGRDGRLAQLVSEDHRAWHAGTGTWGPYRDLNSLSIGIELDNNGTEPFPAPQIDALILLLEDVTRRFRIPRTQVVGHSDVEPVLKNDPSRYFPWKRLAERGFGLWPDETLVDPPAGFDPFQALVQLGYNLKDKGATARAFHRRFRGEEGSGLDEQDLRILFNLQGKAYRLAAPAEAAPPASAPAIPPPGK
jgi:N-acetylmuramoyl-L-alanine amidase